MGWAQWTIDVPLHKCKKTFRDVTIPPMDKGLTTTDEQREKSGQGNRRVDVVEFFVRSGAFEKGHVKCHGLARFHVGWRKSKCCNFPASGLGFLRSSFATFDISFRFNLLPHFLFHGFSSLFLCFNFLLAFLQSINEVADIYIYIQEYRIAADAGNLSLTAAFLANYFLLL